MFLVSLSFLVFSCLSVTFYFEGGKLNAGNYVLVDYKAPNVTWTEANLLCQNYLNEGTLASIKNENEQNIIENLVSSSSHNCSDCYIFIGGRRYGPCDFWAGDSYDGSSNQWEWIDGSLWDYTNWRRGGSCGIFNEPTSCDEQCMRMYSNCENGLEWRDDECDSKRQLFICRYVPVTNDPSVNPTLNPTIYPSTNPTLYPSSNPIIHPTSIPSNYPTSNNPTNIPSNNPTQNPTEHPTENPIEDPTEIPTNYPTNDPTNVPTHNPTNVPTYYPINDPTHHPSNNPTNKLSSSPSEIPSNNPSSQPTKKLSSNPSKLPSNYPSIQPTHKPTITLTANPSDIPSNYPSLQPTYKPTNSLSSNPSEFPSNNPASQPTVTIYPSNNPSSNPTSNRSSNPSSNPTSDPTEYPTDTLTNYPTNNPLLTTKLSHNPSTSPTNGISQNPSKKPTETLHPTIHPLIKTTTIGNTQIPTKLLKDSNLKKSKNAIKLTLELIVIVGAVIIISLTILCGFIVYQVHKLQRNSGKYRSSTKKAINNHRSVQIEQPVKRTQNTRLSNRTLHIKELGLMKVNSNSAQIISPRNTNNSFTERPKITNGYSSNDLIMSQNSFVNTTDINLGESDSENDDFVEIESNIDSHEEEEKDDEEIKNTTTNDGESSSSGDYMNIVPNLDNYD